MAPGHDDRLVLSFSEPNHYKGAKALTRKVQVIEAVTVTDDLDDKELPEDTQPVYFGWGGRRYEIFLSDAHYQAFEKSLAKYVDAAKDVTTQARASAATNTRRGGSAGTRSKVDREHLNAVREWARSNSKLLEQHGLKVPGDRGRLAQGVQDLYDEHNK